MRIPRALGGIVNERTGSSPAPPSKFANTSGPSNWLLKRGGEYRERRRAQQQQRDLQQPAPATVASGVAQAPTASATPPAGEPVTVGSAVLEMAPPNSTSPSSANVFATIFDWEDSLDGLPPAADEWPVIFDQLPEAKAARAAAGIHEDDYREQLWRERHGRHSHSDDDDELD